MKSRRRTREWRAGPGFSPPRANGSLDAGWGWRESASESAGSNGTGDGDQLSSLPTQDCAPGYTRTGSGLYLGHCEMCECNGHSDLCHPETGSCSVRHKQSQGGGSVWLGLGWVPGLAVGQGGVGSVREACLGSGARS